MKFRTERDVFADAVAWAARSLSPRPAVPVLSGLLLEVDSNGLAISGFDYEVSARVLIDVDSAAAGRVLVPGRLLADITRSLPAQPVEVESEGSRVVVSCGASRFTLPTMPVEDYPTLPDMPEAAGSLGSDAFAAAVTSVAIAAGRDDSLPVLTGVRIEIEDDRLTLAATDRYRLAIRELSWQPGRSGISTVALVPARTLAETARALTTGAEVTIALAAGAASGGDGMIGFSGGGQVGDRRTTTRLLDGEFPKYRSLLPTEFSGSATVDTAPLVEAVKRVALVAERATPVRVSFAGGEAILEAGSGEAAAAREALPVDFDGDELTIAFNPQFLLDGLGALDSDTATLSFTTATKPAVLTGKAGGSASTIDDYRYLLMPVRLSG
jgi:DNA polymerase III subunit beta